MKRPIHAFKIGQQVYHHTGGLPRGKRTGPYTIVGLVRQSSGTILFKIKSATREQLAHESELKLVLMRSRKASD
jgi:ABC-type lipopolysaccharide export system ATPase subunit